MAWVRFTSDFEYRQPSYSTDYKAGWSGSVRAQCADAAVVAGKAVKIATPRRTGTIAANTEQMPVGSD